jgi:hypothetical protein
LNRCSGMSSNFVSKVSHSTSRLQYDQAFDCGGGIL